MTQTLERPVESAARTHQRRASGGLHLLVLLLALAGGLAAVWGGPPMGDHEALVAQIARNMRLSGDWVVPQFVGTPYMRKPPLPYWLVAASSYLFPNDPATGLPVTTAAARLPSGLAAFGTVLLIWKLASVMFGRRVGLIAGLIGASNIFLLLYAPNATAEMPLTFCCTWAYFHFWMAVRNRGLRSAECANDRGRRALHMLGFYVALGMAMLAKGPAPLPMVAVPLAVWWYTELPLRILARGLRRPALGARAASTLPMPPGESRTMPTDEPGAVNAPPITLGAHGPSLALRRSGAALVRGLWPRTRAAFTQLWLIPGLLIFAALFVPWMLAVAGRHEHAWDLWNWQYLQRAAGDYEDTRPRGPFYYLQYIVGMTAPWLFLLPEAALAPWLQRYAAWRRPLLFAGLWALVSIAIMSIEPFKKPYYIAPAIPALILMMAVVAERFYLREPLGRRLAQLATVGMAAGLLAGLIAGGIWLHRHFPDLALRLLIIATGGSLLLVLAGIAYARHRAWAALVLTAVATLGTFNIVWYTSGHLLGDMQETERLARALDELNLPADATIYWADRKPEARLAFYFNRDTRHLTPPSQIVLEVVDRTSGEEELYMMALENAEKVMSASEPAYLLVTRRAFDMIEQFSDIHGQVLATVQRDAKRPHKDLLIVANSAHRAGAR